MILVLLGLAFIGYAKWLIKDRQPACISDEHSRSLITEDLEETVSALAEQLQEENDRLLERLKQMKEQTDHRIDALEKQTAELQQQLKMISQTGDADSARLSGISKKRTLRQRYEKLFALHDRNMPISEIAKQTGIHEGEIELIVQLAKQEEADSSA